MASESFKNSLTDSALEELYEESHQLGIHKKSYSLIDTNSLNIHVLPSDATKITGKMRNTYVASMMLGYNLSNSVDIALLTNFVEDIENWKIEDFAALDRDIGKAFRELLAYRGIYLGKPTSKINNLLANLTKAEDIPEWDDDVLIKSKVHEETYACGRKQNLLAAIAKAQVPAQTSSLVIMTEDRKSEENLPQAQIVKNQPIPYVEQNQSNLPNLPNPPIERQLTAVSDTQYPLERQQ
ncbi:hypothetical protein GcC1_123022, partial [Golovinomyces cichoracearum]